ncbi:MAG: hypothetical protein SF029_20570, partial [bacterium]|nr:hypothetical protein [bacterium]
AVTVSISAAGTGSPAYTLNTTSLTFPANSVDGATQNVSVTVTQADAGDKLTLNMGVAGPATVGARGVHTVDFVGLEWCQTFDFALDDGGLIGIYGGWSNGAWRSANLTPHERVAMRIAFPSTQLNTIRIKYTCSRPSGGGSRRIDWDWSETSGTVFQAYGTLSANSGSFDTTFTKTVTTTKLRVLIDTASDMTGENTITYLQVCGMGANPFI